MSRILITGASGFLGRHIASALAQRGDFVVALIRDGLTHWSTKLPANVFINGGFEQVERAIAEYEVSTVIHLAASTQVSVAVANPVAAFEANIEGTWKVLEACRRQNVKRVIVASSDKAYSDGPVPYVETQPLRPGGIYATSKACADMLATSYVQEYKMCIAITRCGNIFGPGHLNWSTLIPGTIRSLLRNEVPVLRSNGKARRDYLFVEDAVDGYLKLADSTVVGAFNFGCGGRGFSVLQVVNAITEMMGSKVAPIIADNSNAVEIDEQVLDYSKAAQVLGWGPKHTLGEGLEKTVAWYREYLKERS